MSSKWSMRVVSPGSEGRSDDCVIADWQDRGRDQDACLLA